MPYASELELRCKFQRDTFDEPGWVEKLVGKLFADAGNKHGRQMSVAALDQWSIILDDLGFDNLVRLAHDDRHFYVDTAGAEKDLKVIVEDYLYRLSTSKLDPYERLDLSLERTESNLTLVLGITLKVISDQEYLANVHLSGVERGKKKKSDQALFQHVVARTTQTLRKYLSADYADFNDCHEVEGVTKPPKRTRRALPDGKGLFPLFGVTPGKTTIKQLKKLGTHTKSVDDEGERYKIYVVNGVNIWYDDDLASHLYLTHTDALPRQWVDMGFSWEKSYNEWLKVLEDMGCYVSVIEQPRKTKHYSGKFDSFSAALKGSISLGDIAYSLKLGFDYSRGTTVKDKGTLYNLAIGVE